MKILAIDIETSPNLAYVFALWKQNISIDKIVDSTEMLCFAAKWLGEKEILYYSLHHDGKDEMITQAYHLLNEADAVLHYNGKNFDVPHLNREFLQAGLKPPTPFKQIDLVHAARKQFRFPSNKLDYVSQAVGLKGKTKHEGFELWRKCMEGDDKAWRTMRRYNIQDVRLLEQLYKKLLPWIPGHPNVALFEDGAEDVCPGCGSKDLAPQGFAVTQVSKFQRYQCRKCGRWSRSGRRVAGVNIREIAS